MHDITKIVDSLEDKILKFIERNDFLSSENDLLRSQLSQLQHEYKVKTQQISENEQELHSLRVAKTIQGSDYSKETTQKIQTLVKEIDWCIAQLSD